MPALADLIALADAELPGQVAPEGETDPRWQRIIAIGEFVESNPLEIWPFVARWGTSDDPDLQSAIATCLLEHLLEHHFELVFPQVRVLARADRNFAATFRGCWKSGQAQQPGNNEQFDALASECRK